MPEPRPRTPAQIEASRRNGAGSRGPVTQEGRARSSRNALKHGLCAMQHLVLEDEVPDDLEALIAHLTEEVGAVTEIEARLARRLAIAFWKGERAERIEVALFDAAPKIRPPAHGFQWEEADPLTTFDVRRFNAIRGQQAQIGREIRSCLAELRRLRKDARDGTDEPEECAPEEQNYTNDLSPCTLEPEPAQEHEPNVASRNEPGHPPPANDDVAEAADPAALVTDMPLRDEPDAPAPPRVAALRAAIMAELAARHADPERDHIKVSGKLIAKFPHHQYFAYHKPVGIITTLSDPEGRPCIGDVVESLGGRLYPVGRLDFHSSGLLLLTNDGELTARLTHPSSHVEKRYTVKVAGMPTESMVEKLRHGVKLEDGKTAPAYVRVERTAGNKAWIDLRIIEGRNRQVRRMLESVGLRVEKLRRTAVGPVKLGDLPTGAARRLSVEEVEQLRRAAGAH